MWSEPRAMSPMAPEGEGCGRLDAGANDKDGDADAIGAKQQRLCAMLCDAMRPTDLEEYWPAGIHSMQPSPATFPPKDKLSAFRLPLSAPLQNVGGSLLTCSGLLLPAFEAP